MTAQTFGDISTAAALRDIVKDIATKAAIAVNPPSRIATITFIDLVNGQCEVLYPGASGVGAGISLVSILSVAPQSVGQVVKIDGMPGYEYISAVFGATQITGVGADALLVPDNIQMTSQPQQITTTWEDVAADSYEVRFSNDSLFTDIIGIFPAATNQLTRAGFTPFTRVYADVRSCNKIGDHSDWSSYNQVDVIDYHTTDGEPPASSPTANVIGALGFLITTWTQVANRDLVTYEVHMSLTAGFEPNSTTKLGETNGNSYMISEDATGAALVANTTYYVRLIAKDDDGAALRGGQGYAQISVIDLGDVGNIPYSSIHDGSTPSGSPNLDTLTPAVGMLLAKWTFVANGDLTSYEVHVGSYWSFAPDANSKVLETNSNYAFIRTQGAGTGYAALVQGVPYYVKLWAKDQDGYAPAAGSATGAYTAKVNTPDLVVGAIAVGSGIIADLAVDEEHINNSAVTNIKIGDGAIDRAKIQNLEVIDAKIYTLGVYKLTAGTINARIVIGSKFTTSYSDYGSRVEFDGNGIRLYNASNILQVDLNTTYGSGTFTGNINASTITGSLFRTASSGSYLSLGPSIFHSSSAPGIIWTTPNTYVYDSRMPGVGYYDDGTTKLIQLSAGEQSSSWYPHAFLDIYSTDSGSGSQAQLQANNVYIIGNMVVDIEANNIDITGAVNVFITGSTAVEIEANDIFLTGRVSANVAINYGMDTGYGGSWRVSGYNALHEQPGDTYFWHDTSGRNFAQIHIAGYTIGSSRTFKKKIAKLSHVKASRLLDLEPVKFHYKAEDDGERHGLIAEDVAKVMPEIVFYDEESGAPTGIRFSEFIPSIITLLQQQHRDIKVLQENQKKVTV